MNFTDGRITNKTYLPRLKTDALFELAPGSFSYTGEYDRAARFVEGHQSKNKILWSTFADRFRLHEDSYDGEGGWRGEYWGKMMRGACWIYKYTSDKELYAILEATVRDLLSTAEKSGRISSYASEKEFIGWDMWCRKYVLLGMQYFYDICDDEALKETIITALCRHLDYIIDHIGSGEDQIDILRSTYHAAWGGLNSSSILEPVVRLYNITGDEKYIEFAKYLVERGGSSWGNIYVLAVEGKIPPYEYPVRKAYEAMSYFEGVLEYYRVTGDEDAKAAFLNFMSLVIETDLSIIGCSGSYDELFDHSSVMQTEVNDEVKQETCVTVTLMKACYQALCFTGDAKFADVIELAGYNAMLGSINFNKNTVPGTDKFYDHPMKYFEVLDFVKKINGYTFDAYAPLYKDKRNRRVGGFKMMKDKTAYGCCACIGSAGVALMPISSVMAADDGLRINHLMNGTVKTGDVTLEIATNYPYGESATVKVFTELDTPFAIGIRIPEFANGKMTVNGEVAVSDGKGYAIVEGCWKNGDEISIVIPREVTVHELNGKIALTKGAITFALDERVQDLEVAYNGKIKSISPFTPEFAVREAFEVEFEGGKRARFVDFASAGDDWGNAKNKVSVWIDKE